MPDFYLWLTRNPELATGFLVFAYILIRVFLLNEDTPR